MKIKHIISTALLLPALALTSCLEETFPTSGALAEQVATDLPGISNGIPAYLNRYNNTDNCDCGYPGLFSMQRDVMVGELPIVNGTYDYYQYFLRQSYLGNWNLQQEIWIRYYAMVQKTNLVIGMVDLDNVSTYDAPYIGDALAYRAWTYSEMMQSYEYLPTGVASLDDYATANDIWGLTVPIVTEKTSETDGRKNPRAPFYEMYRFILSDLDLAEKLLANTHVARGRDHFNLAGVYALKARLWLTIATRFRLNPDDLATQLEAESSEALAKYSKLNITTANDCYANAASYARLAIGEGATPLTRQQWFDPSTGFNSVNDSWLLAYIISTSDNLTTLIWQSFTGFISPEASWGVCTPDYNAARMINARLYEKIQAADWRKNTWIAPSDAGLQSAYNSTYSSLTNLTYDEWSKHAAYTGFKFHPAGGETVNSNSGIAISLPLIRIEEMYFIEAEALASTQGAAAGKQALESFMNTYRTEGGTYTCPSSAFDDVVTEIFNQKRIEFWGEGIVYFDFKRLRKAIENGYPGTNQVEANWSNSYPDRVAPWTIYYIPNDERNKNTALKLNPDPSQAIPLWTE